MPLRFHPLPLNGPDCSLNFMFIFKVTPPTPPSRKFNCPFLILIDFWIKTGASNKSSRKFGKLDIILTFGPRISLVLVDLTFFWPNKGKTAGGFHYKLKKKWHESFVSLRAWNMGMRNVSFLENWRFVYKIWVWECLPSNFPCLFPLLASRCPMTFGSFHLPLVSKHLSSTY